MEASQAFYSYLSRTLARTPRCHKVFASSRIHPTQSHSRRKQGIRTFTSSHKRRSKEDEPRTLPSSPSETTPSTTEAPLQPARSFRRPIDRKTSFVSRFESPAPPSFGSSSSEDARETPIKARPTAQEARGHITNLLDAAYGPRKNSQGPKGLVYDSLKDIIPGRTSTRPGPSSRPKDPFNPAIYDTLAAYEATPRTRSPSSPSGTDPSRALADALDASDILRDHEASVRMRLKPTLGRTVPVNLNRNVDLTRAFRMLEFKNQQNSIKQDEREQRFHVRKGQMRKIMRRRRWRVTFLAGYLEECKRVRRMRKQGW